MAIYSTKGRRAETLYTKDTKRVGDSTFFRTASGKEKVGAKMLQSGIENVVGRIPLVGDELAAVTSGIFDVSKRNAAQRGGTGPNVIGGDKRQEDVISGRQILQNMGESRALAQKRQKQTSQFVQKLAQRNPEKAGELMTRFNESKFGQTNFGQKMLRDLMPMNERTQGAFDAARTNLEGQSGPQTIGNEAILRGETFGQNPVAQEGIEKGMSKFANLFFK